MVISPISSITLSFLDDANSSPFAVACGGSLQLLAPENLIDNRVAVCRLRGVLMSLTTTSQRAALSPGLSAIPLLKKGRA